MLSLMVEIMRKVCEFENIIKLTPLRFPKPRPPKIIQDQEQAHSYAHAHWPSCLKRMMLTTDVKHDVLTLTSYMLGVKRLKMPVSMCLKCVVKVKISLNYGGWFVPWELFVLPWRKGAKPPDERVTSMLFQRQCEKSKYTECKNAMSPFLP